MMADETQSLEQQKADKNMELPHSGEVGGGVSLSISLKMFE